MFTSGLVCLAISLLFFLFGLVWLFFLSRKKSTIVRLSVLTLAVIAAVLPLKFYHPRPQAPAGIAAQSAQQTAPAGQNGQQQTAPAAGSGKPQADPGDASDRNSGWSSFIETLQAFTLDADYEKVFGSAFSGAAVWLKIYIFILYSVAPIVGGVVIYDVVAGVSPYLKLVFVFFRRLYVFSDLNRASLCLAQSLLESDRRARTVFFHCSGKDVDDDIGMTARDMKAICIPDGFTSVWSIRHGGARYFFLMKEGQNGDFDDSGNLNTLRALLDIWTKGKKCRVYCCANSAAALENVRAAKAEYDGKAGRFAGRVRIHAVNDYMQTAYSLMREYPLYDSLPDGPKGKPGKRRGTPLRVLIVGRDPRSLEMFKTVFWCGQLLDHPLEIAMVSLEEDGAGSIREIKKTLETDCPELLESCTERSSLLRSSFDGKYAPVYASVCFASESLKSACRESFLTKERRFEYGDRSRTAFSRFDYFILMPGNDGEAAELAGRIWRNLVHLNYSGEPVGRKIIAAEIEDDRTGELLRLRRGRTEKDLKKNRMKGDEAVVRIFGSLRDRFRWETFVPDCYRAYPDAVSSREALHSLPGLDATKDDIYSEWSDQARKLHLSYKMFSAFQRPPAKQDAPDKMLREKIEYCGMFNGDSDLRDRLAWLEHRRWNAFLRARGFRQSPGLIGMLKEQKKGKCKRSDWRDLSVYAYKHVPARLHPNLVECVPGSGPKSPDFLDLASGIRDIVDEKRYDETSARLQELADNGRVDELAAAVAELRSENRYGELTKEIADLLSKKPYNGLASRIRDALADNRRKYAGPNHIKQYDAPGGKYGPVLTETEVCAYLLGEEEVEKVGSKKAWKTVRKKHPGILEIRDKDRPYPGAYYAEDIIPFKRRGADHV